jgi:hypothetical protein
MTVHRLSLLQWVGLLVGGGVWIASFFAGVGVSEVVCNPASGRWGVPYDTTQIALAAASGLVVLAAEGAAIVVFRATRGVGDEEPPPHGRLHFFATAAMVANLVFLVIIVLVAVATVVDRTCHQA